MGRNNAHGVGRWQLSPAIRQIVVVACLFGLLAWGGITLTEDTGRIAALWLPNAMLVAVLLGPFRTDARLSYAGCYMANVVAALLIGDALFVALALSACNIVEVAIVVASMRARKLHRPDVSRLPDLVTLTLAGGVLAPLVSATLAIFTIAVATGQLDAAVWRSWYAADALGMIIAAPVLLVLMHARKRSAWNEASTAEIGLLLSLVTCACVVLFLQNSYPLLFIAAPFVVLAAFRLGAPGAAVSIILVAAVSAIATALDSGPITLVKGNIHDRLIVLQLFLATSFLTALPVAAAVTEQRRIMQRLRASEKLRTSITDNMREVMFKTDAAGRWTFLNPEWERLTGHLVAASLGRRIHELIYQEDRKRTDDQFDELMTNHLGELLISHRFTRADGHVRWVESLIRRQVDERGAIVGTIGSIRDVTERVVQNLALETRERELRLLADHSSDMVVRIGLDGVRRYVSPACRQLLGYEPEELVGETPIAAIHADDRARVERTCRGLLDGSETPICTYRQRRKDGHYASLEAVYQLVRDDGGQPVEFVATVRDISQRHHAELRATEAISKLEESHRLLTMAGTIAHIGHWRMDIVAREVTLSDEAARILAVAPGTQAMSEDGAERYVPEDRAHVREALAHAMAGKPFAYEARISTPDGRIRSVFTQGQPELAPNGAPMGVVGVIQDVSDRVAAQLALTQSEARHRLLAENATDVVLRTGVDGEVTYISPSCVELSGYRPGELVGKPAADFIHPNDLPMVHAAHIAIVTGSQPGATIEYRLKHKDGGWRWLESHMKGWRGPEGLAGGVISAIRDIARRKQMEADLVAARDVAEAAASAKAAFLANMSHEIRTPMNGVLGFTQLVLSTDLTAEQRSHLELIADSGRSMMRLLNDILDMSKIQSGKMVLVTEPVDLRHVTQRCVELMAPGAIAKGVRISTIFDVSLPPWITGDSLRPRQILLNLVGNAVKFTGHGEITIRVDVVDTMLRLDVIDTGIGIPADRLSAIFDQFSQADAAIARNYGGTGLGLNICAELASLMEGAISVESVVGRGTKFTVTIPCQPVDDRACSRSPSHGPMKTVLQHAANPKILIAEDHDINQVLILAMAKRAGMDAVIAADGREAIAKIEAAARNGEPFQLVLMDMHMPAMGGLEATRALRAMGYGPIALPIVALTANAYAEDVQACLDAGMQAHLAKPVALGDLTAMAAQFIAIGEPAQDAPVAHSPKLLDRYHARKVEVLRVLERLDGTAPFDEAICNEAREMLHKLAGTAAMFGEAELGDAARSLELALEAMPPSATHDGIDDVVRRLGKAA